MKKALIYYFSGLGDIIILSPCLRKLYEDGYVCDMMVRVEAITSHLLDDSPYVGNLIPVENPWTSEKGYTQQQKENVEMFESLRKNYDWSGKCLHDYFEPGESKIDANARELGLTLTDRSLDVQIPEHIKFKEKNSNYDLFLHWEVPNHPDHTWEGALDWCKENLIFDSVYDTAGRESYDIRAVFEIMRKAKHRVICSSVFVHAADALGVYVDCVNYGRQDRKVLMTDLGKCLRIRECGMFLDRDNRVWK